MVLEKKIFKVFTIYGHGGHLGHVTLAKYINILSSFAWRLHMKLNKNSQVVSEKRSFENVDDGWTTDTGDYHPISSPGAPGSGDLKTDVAS